MRIHIAEAWTSRAPTASGTRGLRDILTRIAAIVLLTAMVVRPWIVAATMPNDAPAEDAKSATGTAGPQASAERETLIAGYVGWPEYYRSNVHVTRPDKTDVELKRLGWDGDALYFPIDGGIRSVQWWHATGFMVDFLHNKAISRLGKGGHGRKLANPIIEEVEATGTIQGQPAPPRLKLTEMFERLEFTHGHNMLLFTPMLQLGNITPRLRPYVGVGAGFALPHFEVWAPGEERETRTSEYQYAGPATQLVAGLEFRSGKLSYFLEYKFTWAWISGSITGQQSWFDSNMPGDLWRQASRWWRGEEPRFGRISTRLAAHQLVGGVGYWWNRGPAR